MFLFQQTKRKLDDAAKRLGYLYDKLREQSVRNDDNIGTQGYLYLSKTSFSHVSLKQQKAGKCFYVLSSFALSWDLILACIRQHHSSSVPTCGAKLVFLTFNSLHIVFQMQHVTLFLCQPCSSLRTSWMDSTRSAVAWRARITSGVWRSTPRWSAAATSARSLPSCPSLKWSWPLPTSWASNRQGAHQTTLQCYHIVIYVFISPFWPDDVLW